MKNVLLAASLVAGALLIQSCDSQNTANNTETETDSVSTPTTDAGNDTTNITGVGGTTVNKEGVDSAIDTGKVIEVPVQTPTSR